MSIIKRLMTAATKLVNIKRNTLFNVVNREDSINSLGNSMGMVVNNMSLSEEDLGQMVFLIEYLNLHPDYAMRLLMYRCYTTVYTQVLEMLDKYKGKELGMKNLDKILDTLRSDIMFMGELKLLGMINTTDLGELEKKLLSDLGVPAK